MDRYYNGEDVADDGLSNPFQPRHGYIDDFSHSRRDIPNFELPQIPDYSDRFRINANSTRSGSRKTAKSRKPRKSRKSRKSKSTRPSEPPEPSTSESPSELQTLEDKIDHLENLSHHDAAILKEQIANQQNSKVTYFTLYRYMTKFDMLILSLAYLCSIVEGAALPMYTIVFGNLTQVFTDFFVYHSNPEDFQAQVNHNTLYFVYLGIGIAVVSYIETFLHVDRGEVLTARIRQHYLKAILRQNIGYFDRVGSGEVTNRITTDTHLIQDGISEKIGLIVSGVTTFLAAFVIGFIKSWKLTFILCSIVVSITLGIGIASSFIVKYTIKAIKTQGEGSSQAEEVLSSIRNTVAFGTQERLAAKYDTFLWTAMKYGHYRARAIAFMIGTLWGVCFLGYALAFWQGSRFIVSGVVNVGDIITTILAMIIGAFSLGGVAPNFQAIGTAVGAAQKVFEAIDRVPPIDSFSEQGFKLDDVEGRIELRNVKFVYPSRPDVTIFNDMSLVVEPGQTVALVGASGSGKSTIIGLLERFYSPLSGKVLVDGYDIEHLNVKWLRQQISLVSQEPTLFSCSIYDNIEYGLIGSFYENATEDVKRELIISACKEANAWLFIQSLSNGLDTHVGERGFLLSGGQKQRIAIARAIVSQPKILLLDEATSALDTRSEGVVQQALDRAAKCRTTIVIAHRLSTIRDADKIVVFSHGNIVESGTHDELLELKGAYHSLVHAQHIDTDDSKADVLSLASTNADSETFEERNPLTNISTRDDTTMIHEDLIPFERDHDSILNYPEIKRSTFYLIRMLYRLNREDKYLMIIGAFLSVICGLGYPAMSILLGKIMETLMVGPDQYDYMRSQVNYYCGFFILLAGVEIIAFIVMLIFLISSNESLVRKIRLQVFRKLLQMDIAFFDSEENSTGALTSLLAKDAQEVEGLGGATLGQILNSLTTLIAGVVLSISVNWRLGLVCTACVPVLLGCGFVRLTVLTHLEARSKKVYEQSGFYACEGVAAIRTVACLTKEDEVWKKYCEHIDSQVSKSRMTLIKSALLYGLSQGMSPLIMGLGFWYGASLLKVHEISIFQYYVAFNAIIFGAQTAGQVFSFAPSMGKAKGATASISKIFDMKSSIDYLSTKGQIIENPKGEIIFRNVYFNYPTRPHVPVLRGLNLTISPGQYVALVGASGCGKSTTIGLIERFYNPDEGSVKLDGVDISDLNVSAYREHIALVQQEPVLYFGTIRENIMLGSPDEELGDDAMYDAAMKANIHDFIMSLPEGYDTLCGSKGVLLSGGQKQRIAIARALIRNPKILLLDEATSALDSESEQIVQQALDAAAEGRTTIAIAHRLSTIQNADVIYVFSDGRIVEYGSHSQLLANKAHYYELVRMQALGVS